MDLTQEENTFVWNPICPGSDLMSNNPREEDPITRNYDLKTPLAGELTSNFSRKFSWTGRSLLTAAAQKDVVMLHASWEVSGHVGNSMERHSPRHLREAQLTVAIKIEHPQLSVKKINGTIYQNEADTKRLL